MSDERRAEAEESVGERVDEEDRIPPASVLHLLFSLDEAKALAQELRQEADDLDLLSTSVLLRKAARTIEELIEGGVSLHYAEQYNQKREREL